MKAIAHQIVIMTISIQWWNVFKSKIVKSKKFRKKFKRNQIVNHNLGSNLMKKNNKTTY